MPATGIALCFAPLRWVSVKLVLDILISVSVGHDAAHGELVRAPILRPSQRHPFDRRHPVVLVACHIECVDETIDPVPLTVELVGESFDGTLFFLLHDYELADSSNLPCTPLQPGQD